MKNDISQLTTQWAWEWRQLCPEFEPNIGPRHAVKWSQNRTRLGQKHGTKNT